MTAAAGADKSITLHTPAGRRHAHTFAAHDAPISGICMPEVLSHQDRILISASWDRTARVWDLRSTRSPVHVIPLPERATALASAGPEVLIATADRAVHAVARPRARHRRRAALRGGAAAPRGHGSCGGGGSQDLGGWGDRGEGWGG